MSPSPFPERGRGGTGTSLIELLGALTAAAMLVLALLEGVSAAAEAWNRQIAGLGMEREARSALRLLLDDWQNLAPPPRVQAMQPAWPSFHVETPDRPGASSRLAFLRTHPARQTTGSPPEGGDLQLVLYDVILTPDGGATSAASRQTSPKLVRRVFPPAETYQRLRAHHVESKPLFSDADWQALRESPDEQEWLAHDVIRFLAMPALAADPKTPTPIRFTHLDLTLRVTHRAIARLLRSEADWQGEGLLARWLHQYTPDNPNDDREVRTYTLRLAAPVP